MQLTTVKALTVTAVVLVLTERGKATICGVLTLLAICHLVGRAL
jgi:hypothetical protein